MLKVAFVFKMKKLTTQEFIEKAQKIHGERYDYSKVDYKDAHSKVCIICPTHGEFWQKPNNHTNGQNCPMCRYASARTGGFGVGVLDKPLYAKKEKSERAWRQMLRRACSEDFKRNSKAYEGVSVCEEWKTYSKFKEWFEEHYVEGWALDKDILIKGNKEYGPQACCYVPPQINSLFTKRTRDRGPYPIGVTVCRGRISASVNRFGKNVFLGHFDTAEEAFYAYKNAKEKHIKEVAELWRSKIEPRLYEALCNYVVEITD